MPNTDGNRTHLVKWPSKNNDEAEWFYEHIKAPLLKDLQEERERNPEFDIPKIGEEIYFAHSDF